MAKKIIDPKLISDAAKAMNRKGTLIDPADNLLSIEAGLPGRYNINLLLSKLDVEPEGVVGAAAENAALFIDACQYRIDRLHEQNEAKMQWEEAQADCQLKTRNLARTNQVKMNEGEIDATVMLYPPVTAARHKLAAAEEAHEWGRLLVEAYKMRRDMIEVIGYQTRDELLSQAKAEDGRAMLDATRKKLQDRFPMKSEDGY